MMAWKNTTLAGVLAALTAMETTTAPTTPTT